MCWLLAEMSRQAELYRRYMGEEAREYLTEELVRVSLLPSQLQRVRGEIADAILAGMHKEEGTKRSRFGATRTSKKNGKRLTRARMIYMAGTVGMSPKEAMLEKPGMVFDLYEVYKEANGYEAEEREPE